MAAVERFGPLHATDHRTPYLSLLARLDGFALSDLDRAWLRDHRLDRRSVMRGTLHLVPADRLANLVCVFGEPDPAEVRYLRQAGIDARVAKRLAHAVVAVISEQPIDSNGIKRRLDPQLRDEATAKTIGGSVLAMVLRWMVESGALALTAPRGPDGEQTSGWVRSPRAYARFASLFAESPPCDRAEADDRLARWYFVAHGPASARDWAWWTGLPARRTAAAFERIRPKLDEVAVDGWPEPVYVTEGVLDDARWRSTAEEGPAVRLLPYEDSAIKAYRATRQRFFDPRVPEGHHTSFGEVLPTILLDGRVVGTWSSGVGGWSGALEAATGKPDRGLWAEPAVPLPPEAARALDAELTRVRDAASVAPTASGSS